MKRFLPFLCGLFLGAFLFGACGIFLGYNLAHSNQPAVVVRNATHGTISQVKIETDVSESYVIPEVPAQQSRRTKLSGKDKVLWIKATTLSNKILTSEKIYVTSEGIVFAIVSEDVIALDYEP